MVRSLSKKRGYILAIALAVMVIPTIAYAHDGAEEEVHSSTETSTTSETSHHENAVQTAKDKVEAAKEATTERVAAAKERLSDAKLKRCETKQKTITNIMTRIADRGQKQLDLFGTIAERTQTFYTEKGHTLENYSALVSDVAAKKSAAQAAVTSVQTANTTFSCDGDDPHGVVDGFKSSLKDTNAALKEYKTAVKNLIVGVKSVQPDKTSSTTSEGVQQ